MDEISALEIHNSQKGEFLILSRKAIEMLLETLAEKKIHSRDIAILLVCMRFTNWRSGRYTCTAQKIAEVMQVKVGTVYPALKRLKDNGLIFTTKNAGTGQVEKAVNPFILKPGDKRLYGYAKRLYEDECGSRASDSSFIKRAARLQDTANE